MTITSVFSRLADPGLLLTVMLGIINYKGKVKSSNLAYNRRETRDKWPLGRDPDSSWCHVHTSVKLFLQPSVLNAHMGN